MRRPNRLLAGITAVALVMTQVAIPPAARASHLGSSTASAGSAPPPSVAAIQSFQPDLFTGRATTSIPIAVPPGRKGMQPSLGLTYSSSGRNGWLGVGWGLDLGYIEHSTKNGVPSYTTSDTFAFMFQGVTSELVQIPDGTYRAKDEGLFLRFESKGIDGWEVRDKSGTRYVFGGSPDSEQTAPQGTFRWCLRKVVETNGNFLTITYVKDQGQIYPTRIDYTGHETSGIQDLAPANRVELLTETRPDADVSLRSGTKITTGLRLKEIAAYAQGQLARKYTLNYSQSTRTGRSVLASVTQIGTDGVTSLPPTTFAYQGDAVPTYALTSNSGATGQAAYNVRVAVHDFRHENFGCGESVTHPYAGLNWSSPQVVSSSASIGCVTWTVNSDGTISASSCQDRYIHAWIWVYLANPASININTYSFCAWKETAGNGVQLISANGSTSFPAGWSILHLTAHHEHEGFSANQTVPLQPQVTALSPSQFIKPQLAGDVDGNGITDLITFDAVNGTWTVSCSRTCAFSPSSPWLTGFGGTSSVPLLGDWNGDGRTDIATYNGGSWQFATSTGTSFQTGTIASLSHGSGTPITGDFNGDGLTDIGTYSTTSTSSLWSIALATGPGFAPTSSFNFDFGDANYDPLTGDFNGDGLTDVAVYRRTTGDILVTYSTGTRFVLAQPSDWIGGFAAGNPHTTADFNGDGLTDVAYYDKPTGQVRYAASTGTSFSVPATLPATFSLRSPDDGLQVGDFNGDGLADPAVFNSFTGASELTNSQGTFVDLLSVIQNGIGGSTTLQYQPSTQCDNTCPIEQLPKLPFIIPVVNQATLSDGLGNTITTTYFYRQGRYDAPTREFRGFAHVEVRDAQGTVSVTEFHQDEHKKGRPIRTEVRDPLGNLWTAQEHTWSCADPFPGVHFAKLDQTDSSICDGDTICKTTRARLTYDAYGNVTRADQDGDVSLLGDERSTVTTYTDNLSAWIIGKPALVQTLDAAGTVVAQRRFYYDGSANTTDPPARGNLTKEEEWLNLPTAQWLATDLTYDPYGNVKTVKDALNRTTTNTYDPSGTFLIQITNVLNHSRQLTYDSRTGQVLTSTDQNGVVAFTRYDALGRATEAGFVDPATQADVVTTRTAYDLTTVPARTTVIAYTGPNHQSPITNHQFIDGLGRTIQTRSPAEDPLKQVVTGAVEFNARGQVIKQWVPYLSSLSASYVPLSLEPSALSLAAVSYTYDAMGRLLTTTDPDGSITSTSYNDWSVTSTDANTHQTRRTNDAYGRLATVKELNNGQTYTTSYQYDALDNLIRVQQWGLSPQGTVPIATTHITYDTLGRKIAMDDPDMGAWRYAYDAVDNLTSQTDARGVVTTFVYDTLNRLTQKTYALPPASSLEPTAPVSYTYDDPLKLFSKGKLTGITDGSGSSSFEYDHLGRLVKESKTIDGTAYTIQRAYDLLGRLTALTYPDGEIASYTYNAQGGIETVTGTVPGGGLSPYVTNVDYNAAGQLTKIVYGNGTISDYTYNPQTLRLASLITNHPSSGVLQDFTYSFDPTGNVAAITDRVHTGSQTFGYDALNRLTLASGSYGTYTYAYDPIGNMLEKEGVQMSYGEGAAGLPAAPGAAQAGPHAVTSTSNGLALMYDANGNLIKKSPTALSLEPTAQLFQYDAENRLIKVDTAQEETVSVTFQPGWNFFSLPVLPEDGAVVVLLPSFAQNFEQISKFEPATNTFTHYVGNPKFNDFSALEYGVGYQVYCKASSPVTVSIKGKLPTRRLSTSLAPGWHLLPAITYHPSPITAAFSGVDYDQVLTYDGSTLQPVSEVKAAQAYYVHVRTTSTWQPPLPKDVTTRSVYDGDGGRVKQITAAGTTTYLGEVYEKEASGKTTKYVFAGSQRLCAVVRGLSTVDYRYYHGDHLGSSNVVTNAAGQLVELTEHLPYGAVSRHEGTSDVAHKFTGQRQDITNGLILFPARAYDPELGRFIQADPLVQDPSIPQFLNRSTYVRNNPLSRTDPTGLCEATCQTVLFLASLAGWFAWGNDEDNAIVVPILPSPMEFLSPVPLPTSFSIFQGSSAIFPELARGLTRSLTDIMEPQGLPILLGAVDPGVVGGIFLSGASDLFAGTGDNLSFGATDWLRAQWGLNDYVNKSSLLYRAGGVIGFGLGLSIGGAASLNAGSRTVLYSGPGALQTARAGRGGRLLMEQTVGGRFLNALEVFSKRVTGNKLPQGIWDAASAIFAANAKGTIYIFLRNPRARSVYNRIERPVLDFFNNTVRRFM